ncbi:hypothetical protein BDP27DRAFT_1317723 [Rhodocollybia butyracea]|uniref:F-box domain-containing protein n=1 Tax=Rhodocollybia butyracea TaxID=206335 RepID=A0A9P5Q3C6_9AGAR|nr:hypothetical protein BDP27DRAFT_1317723 [Rhodocollybia butyracea]
MALKGFQGSVVEVLDLSKQQAGNYLCANCGGGQALEFDVERMSCAKVINEIRSGVPPSPSRLVDLVKLVFETRSILDCYEAELERLKGLTNLIEGRMTRIRLYREGILYMKAPVRRLPQEVLGEIFKLICCDRESNVIVGRQANLRPLMISQVCSRWHDLVTSMPALWSSFTVDSEKLKAPVFLLFMERSRWRSAIFTSSSLYYIWLQVIQSELFSPPRTFPELRHFEISPYTMSTRWQVPYSKPYVIITCPRLRSFVLHGLDVEFRFTHVCDAVEHVTLRRVSSTRVYSILRSFPNVRDICLELKEDEISPEWQHLTFLCARNLEIHIPWGGDSDFSTMLNSFTMPGLTHLFLQSETRHATLQSFVFLSSWIGHMQPPLTHLSIWHVPFTSKKIMELLRLLPTLLSFNYKEVDTEGIMVNRLLIVLTPPHLCAPEDKYDGDNREDEEFLPSENEQDHPRLMLPNLQKLILTIWSSKLTPLINLLRSRRSLNGLNIPLPCLQKVELTLRSSVEDRRSRKFETGGAKREIEKFRESLDISIDVPAY